MRDLAAQNGIFLGAALSPGPLADDRTYRGLAAAEFNSVTPENHMKWEALAPEQGRYDWAAADEIVEFAQSHGQRIHGHTFVWHNQLPNWLNDGGFSGDELRSVLYEHIDTVAGRYAGRVDSWDVVNEPWEEDGSWRRSIWYERLGEDYIADALTRARRADPHAKLYINDYDIDGINAKSDAMYGLAASLLDRGVPLDGIGCQSHIPAGRLPGDYQENLQRFADLGLEVAITELDVRIPRPVTDEALRQQAEDYRTVVQACLGISACRGVTVWGVSDRYSWVPGWFREYDAALLFDEDHRPKPAYRAVREALGG